MAVQFCSQPALSRQTAATLSRAESLGRCHFNGLEERSAFRRRTTETTSSFSVCSRTPPSLDFVSGGGLSVLGTLWFEGEYPLLRQPDAVPRALRGPLVNDMPLGQPEKAIGHESQIERTMVGTSQPSACPHQKMKAP